MKVDKDFRKVVERELQEWNVSHSYPASKKHSRLHVIKDDISRYVVFPTSASDRRNVFNIIWDLRKVLKELGAEQTTIQ